MRPIAGLVLLALATASCIKTNAAVLDQSVRLARTCEAAVVMYTTPDKAPAGYREIALLNAKGNSAFTSEAGMWRSMRKKASEVGATGIILSGIDEPSAMSKIVGSVVGVGADRKGKAVAIYVAADSSRVAMTCAGR